MFSTDLILVGCGHVARRFVRLLEERAGELRNIHRLDARVVGIATRRHGVAADLRGLDQVESALQQRLNDPACDQTCASRLLHEADSTRQAARSLWYQRDFGALDRTVSQCLTQARQPSAPESAAGACLAMLDRGAAILEGIRQRITRPLTASRCQSEVAYYTSTSMALERSRTLMGLADSPTLGAGVSELLEGCRTAQVQALQQVCSASQAPTPALRNYAVGLVLGGERQAQLLGENASASSASLNSALSCPTRAATTAAAGGDGEGVPFGPDDDGAGPDVAILGEDLMADSPDVAPHVVEAGNPVLLDEEADLLLCVLLKVKQLAVAAVVQVFENGGRDGHFQSLDVFLIQGQLDQAHDVQADGLGGLDLAGAAESVLDGLDWISIFTGTYQPGPSPPKDPREIFEKLRDLGKCLKDCNNDDDDNEYEYDIINENDRIDRLIGFLMEKNEEEQST
jgi:hypothetical protein